jgi:hypothetical protein
MFLPQQNVHTRARVLRAVITRLLHLIESHPPADIQGIQVHAIHGPKEMVLVHDEGCLEP